MSLYSIILNANLPLLISLAMVSYQKVFPFVSLIITAFVTEEEINIPNLSMFLWKHILTADNSIFNTHQTRVDPT